MSEFFRGRVKVCYQGEVFSLGKSPNTINELFLMVLKCLTRELSRGYLVLKYCDKELDWITLTTDEALCEAYEMYPECLRVFMEYKNIKNAAVQMCGNELVINVEKAWKRMRAVFSVFIEGEYKGMGLLINLRLGLTTIKVVTSQEDAKKAMVFFEDSPNPILISPELFFVTSEKIVLFSFKSTYALSDVEEIKINSHILNQSTARGIALCNSRDSDIFSQVKWINIKETIGNRLIFESFEEGAKFGSPVFSENWDLLGVQITGSTCINEVFSTSEILSALKQLSYHPQITSLIQAIDPEIYLPKTYENLILTPSIPPDRVYGLSLKKIGRAHV